MNREKLMKQGLLVERERERDAIEIKIDRCTKELNYHSFPSEGIGSINADAVLQAATELKELIERWKSLGMEIEKLRDEV